MKNGFCNLSGYMVFIAHLNGSLDGTLNASKYFQTILSLVQFLFSFVNNRIFQFSLAKKAVLVTQSFMCLQ